MKYEEIVRSYPVSSRAIRRIAYTAGVGAGLEEDESIKEQYRQRLSECIRQKWPQQVPAEFLAALNKMTLYVGFWTLYDMPQVPGVQCTEASLEDLLDMGVISRELYEEVMAQSSAMRAKSEQARRMAQDIRTFLEQGVLMGHLEDCAPLWAEQAKESSDTHEGWAKSLMADESRLKQLYEQWRGLCNENPA